MSILVIGGTGTVGSPVVRGLLGRGVRVRVLIRSAEKAKSLPEGAHSVRGNLTEASTLAGAMKGIVRVFLLTPLSQTETEEGLAAVRAAQAAGVRHLVYLSVHHVDHAPHVPHFKSKIAIQKALKDSGMAFTLIMANNFYQNDYGFKQAIMQSGIYPQPIGHIGLHRVDVRDIAEAVVNVLTQPGHEGKRYPLVGPESLTGQGVAEVYTRHLDREIRYGGNDLEAWAAQAIRTLPAWMVRDFKIMYQFFQEHGLLATEEDLAQQEQILGHPPISFDAFVGEVTGAW